MTNNHNYYAAGLFDGEGSFFISKKHFSPDSPVVSINNTSYELLEFMKNSFGGNIYKDKTPRKKQNWQWRMSARKDVVNFIELILPLLREKEKIKRGNILLEFCKATTKEQKLSSYNALYFIK